MLTAHALEFYEPIRAYGEDTLFIFDFKKYEKTCVDYDGLLYFHRRNPDSIMGSITQEKLPQKAESLSYIARHMKADYDRFDPALQYTKDYVAWMLTEVLRLHMIDVAKLRDRAMRRAFLRRLKAAGLYPFRRLPEYPKEKEDCIAARSVRSPLRKALYRRSFTRAGYLILSGLLFPYERAKDRLSRLLRGSVPGRRLLAAKHRLFHDAP